MGEHTTTPEPDPELGTAGGALAELDEDDLDEVAGGADVPFANMPIY